ncbi:MAG: cation-transporting P-type ATPase, partial [Myxococcales bacterium]|nr:cation-transporting P-type ATPase [Myxococcales bacterium]
MMGIIVANVPEGLLPTFTLSLAMGAMRLARRNVLVKSLAAVEALGSVQVICTDKTGTLTANQLALSATLSAEGVAIQGDARRRSLECALVASQIRVSQGGLSGDSLDVVVAEAVGAETREAVLRRQQRIFPFDVARRRSAGTRRHDDGLELCMKGAWEAIAPSVVAYQSGDVLRPFGAEEKDRAEALVRRLAGGGARVIAVARRAISLAEGDRPIDELERELELLGLLCFSDPLRPEVPAAVARCRSAGIEVTLITGDHPETARAIAREAGIIHEIQAPVLTGADLAATTEAELAALLADVHVFARTTPEQKLKIVAAFRRRGLRVAMTGDGVNDAPALRAADVGVAMGKSGTDVAREAAQIVLLDDNFASIVAGIEEGRTVFANMRKFLTYVLASNVPEIIPFLLYVVLPVPLALTVVQILVIDLGTDLLPAIGLGREPPAADVMRAPPRASNDRLLDRSLLARAYLFLGLIEAGFSTGLFFLYLVAGGWRYGDDLPTSSALYHSATGLTLTTVILMQIGNLVGRRSETRSGLDAGLVQNTLLILGIVTELTVCVAVLYVPAVASFLRTGPVPLPFLGLALMGPVLLFFFDRMRKRLFVSVR